MLNDECHQFVAEIFAIKYNEHHLKIEVSQQNLMFFFNISHY